MAVGLKVMSNYSGVYVFLLSRRTKKRKRRSSVRFHWHS